MSHHPRIRATVTRMRQSDLWNLLATADLIYTVPTSPEWNQQIAYGSSSLKAIIGGEIEAMTLGCAVLEIDWDSDEPECLHAALMHLRGQSDLFENAVEPTSPTTQPMKTVRFYNFETKQRTTI